MQIIALKNVTRNWVRVNGVAEECFDIDIKQNMLVECPVLTKH
ncbi:putative pyridoxamine 5'-phosphate oxidase family protein, partial [Clostridium butyricum]|nr:putative pyridoxamine 5'-phosphate oxidase family protein [Clostridium butyricum]